MSDSSTSSIQAGTLEPIKQELYDIIRTDLSFEQKAKKSLELGVRGLDVDEGYVARVDPETDHWEAVVSTASEGGHFPTGLELDFGTSYCRRTIEADSSVALHDAPEQGWDDDPAFETHGMHCYHGTTLEIDGDVYGTVCFVAEDPRERFDDAKTMFAELIAQELERELERKHHEAQLTRQINLVNVLNRVLRHNLRNDLSVVRGRAQLMMDQVEDETHGKTCLQNIDELIELAQKARDLDQVIAEDLDRQETDVVALVERIIDDLAPEYPDASFTVEHEGEVTAAVQPSFKRAVEELVENAAKHGGDVSTVAITIERVPNAVEVQIADDGPGLDDMEREVLENGVETSLIHGSGLGLWLAYWIISEHDGDITAETTTDGTVMTLSVPRSPRVETQPQVAQLREARDWYQAAFEEAFDGMVIFDDDARIVAANPEAANIYGLDRADVLGRSLEEFPSDGFEFEKQWTEFKQTGAQRDTATIVAADGTERPVEYTATTDIIPGQHLLVIRNVAERRRRERSLERKRDMFRLTEQVASVGAVEVNPQMEEVRWTDGVRDIHDVADDYEPDVESAFEFFLPSDRKEVQQKFEQCLESGDSYDGEHQIRTADGEVRWVRFHAEPLEEDDGTLLIRGAVQDITEQKHSKRQLRQEREQFEQFVENLPVGVLRATLDGEIINTNSTLQDIYSAESAAQLQNAGAYALFPDDTDREQLLDQIKRTGQVKDKRLEVKTLNGDNRSVRTTLTLMEEDGTQYLEGVVQDVTERRELERKLRQVEMVAESLNDPVYVVDEDGRFKYVNEALVELVGYAEERILGNTPALIKDDDAVEQAGRQLGRLLSDDGPETETFEVTIQPKEGDPIACEDHMGVLPYEGDSFEGSIGILREITERKRRARELRRERDRLDEFAGVMSHDLRNPLNVAQGRLELVREDCESPHLDPVEEAHKRMEELIEELLHLARQGEQVREFTPVALVTLTEQCWQTVTTGEATVHVKTDETVLADKSRLSQLFENLFRNAVQHAGESVTISVGELHSGRGFYVEDDGPGIPENERADVFDAGYSSVEDGTGFGLNIVEQVARAHGWDVRVTDGSAGGARFEVTGVEFTD